MMAKPSEKDINLEEALTAVFGHDRVVFIGFDKCVPPPWGCGGEANEFRDDLSRKEYTISGLCQKCQDSVFGKREE